MQTQVPTFSPGFRLSTVDVIVLIVGMIMTVILGTMTWWWGYVIGFVLGYFFLFCNLFRLSRPLELLWSAIFIALTAGTIVSETPGWIVSIIGSLGVTLVVVVIEMRRPSYHGIGWQRINPGLPEWWESRRSANG